MAVNRPNLQQAEDNIGEFDMSLERIQQDIIQSIGILGSLVAQGRVELEEVRVGAVKISSLGKARGISAEVAADVIEVIESWQEFISRVNEYLSDNENLSNDQTQELISILAPVREKLVNDREVSAVLIEIGNSLWSEILESIEV